MTRRTRCALLTSFLLIPILVGCHGGDVDGPHVTCDLSFAPGGTAEYRSHPITDPRPPAIPWYPGSYEITLRIERGSLDGRLLVTIDSDGILTDEGHPLFVGAECLGECTADPASFACTVTDGDGDPQPFAVTLREPSRGGDGGLSGRCGVDGYVATFDAVAVP